MGALSIALRSLLVPGWDYMCMWRKGVRREGGRRMDMRRRRQWVRGTGEGCGEGGSVERV